MNDRHRLWPAVNALALTVTLVVNWLATALPLNGRTPGEIADSFDVFYKPAGYVFGIWSLIYLGLIAFVAWQWWPGHRGDPRIRRSGPWFAVNLLANAAWVFAWHYGFFVLSAVLIATMLVSIVIVYLRIDARRVPVSTLEWWCVPFPVRLYTAWISVATISNVSVALDWIDWQRFGLAETTWMLVMLAVTAALAAVVAWRRRDVVFLLVVGWALAGIAVEHADTPRVANASVATALLVAVFAAGVLFASLRGRSAAPA